jgi:hypothetical protein
MTSTMTRWGCLDYLYAPGVTEVFYQVASHALQIYGIRSRK